MNESLFSRRTTSLFCLSLSVWLVLAGPFPARLSGEDWPHWRGPERNDRIDEPSGWQNGSWPLRKLWQKNVGEGSSSPIVVEGQLFSIGWSEGRDTVSCLDADTGEPVWQHSYHAPRFGRLATGDQGLYSGPCSTPEFDSETGLLYTLGIDGDLRCWNTRKQGEPVWKLNLYENYDVPQRPRVNRSGRRDYGYTSAPLVWNRSLIVEVGAAEGTLIAFDKRTGKQAWASEARSPAGHTGGPVPIAVEGVPCVAVHHFDGLLVARIDTPQPGRTVAEYPWRTDFANNIASPAVHENNVVLTSAYNHSKMARLRISLRAGAEKVWEIPLPSKVCSPVIKQDHVYWVWRQFSCVDFATGEVCWKGGQFADAGSLIATNDNRLIAWVDNGDLLLVDGFERAADRYQPLAVQKGIGQSDAWPHVVLANQRIYCKDRSGQIVCFALAD